MPAADEFKAIYERLKVILLPYALEMEVTEDSDSGFSLNTRHVMDNGALLFFGSAQIKKNYVSFHVMPVYVFPDLLEDIGDLKKRMQGKSCFNFRKLDPGQVEALEKLVRQGYERYQTGGMLA
jgi:hypothetical protein